MLHIKKPLKASLALALSLTIAITFYPSAAFADTDYLAAYQQAQAETAAAYDSWQAAVADRDAKKAIYDQAKADDAPIQAAVDPALQDMNKKHRLLDLATRTAVDDLAMQAWKNDYPRKDHPEWYADTDGRIQAVLNQNIWTISGDSEAQEMKEKLVAYFKDPHYDVSINNWFPDKQGITTSESGNDDSGSIDLYTRCVYLSESYDFLMMSLDYFDECNQLREIDRDMIGYFPSDTWIRLTNKESALGGYVAADGEDISIRVSPYLMLQSAVNAPMNRWTHLIKGYNCAQNLAFQYGDFGSVNQWRDEYSNAASAGSISYYSGSSSDPYYGLFWSERAGQGGHYCNILFNWTHAGMTCAISPIPSSAVKWGSSRVFEQDFTHTPNATGYTVSEYRNLISSKVRTQLSAYNSAKSTCEKAVKDAEASTENVNWCGDDWIYAKVDAQMAEKAYNNAVAAEETARIAYENSLNSDPTENDDPDAVTQTPEPTQPEQPTQPTTTEIPSTPATPAEVIGVSTEQTSADERVATVPQAQPSDQVKPSEPATPVVKVGTPSIRKIKVNSKKKTAKIYVNAASNAKKYKVQIRRTYKLKGKKKIPAATAWKTYYTKAIDKTSTKPAPVKVKKLTKKSIYQVKVTAINGTAKNTSKVKTFKTK